jgi:hypothetical protein
MGDGLVLVEYVLHQLLPFGRYKSGQLDCPPINLAALLGHRLDRQQVMSSREELAQKLLRILTKIASASSLSSGMSSQRNPSVRFRRAGSSARSRSLKPLESIQQLHGQSPFDIFFQPLHERSWLPEHAPETRGALRIHWSPHSTTAGDLERWTRVGYRTRMAMRRRGAVIKLCGVGPLRREDAASNATSIQGFEKVPEPSTTSNTLSTGSAPTR